MDYWRRVVFDIETDGHKEETTKIHCMVLKDLDYGTLCLATSNRMEDFIRAIRILYEAKIVIGHNIVEFDLPVLSQFMGGYLNSRPLWREEDYSLYEVLKRRGIHIRDSYIMSKLFEPERHSHALESYGIQFGRYKPSNEDWSKLTGHMIYRCIEDCEIQAMTYNYLVDRECRSGWDWVPAIELEQDFAHEQVLQEVEGIDIDEDLCYNVVSQIDCEVDEIDSRIKPNLPKRIKAKGNPVKLPFKKDGTLKQIVTDWFEE